MDTLYPTFLPSIGKLFKPYYFSYPGLWNHGSETIHLGDPYRYNASGSYDRGRDISFHHEILLQEVL